MSRFENQNVLITGAASGIGKLLTLKLLDKGASKLILLDKNRSELQNLSKLSNNIFTFPVDLSNYNEIIKTSKLIKKKNLSIDILINNAGIIVGKNFSEHTHEDILKTIQINSLALMHLTLEFLPIMISRGSGHIVNIASAAGFTSIPKMSVYVASKFCVVGWSESLRIELEREKSGVSVTTVTPYYIDTGMFSGVKSLIPILKPEYVVKKIISGVEKNKIFVKLPFLVKLLPIIKGILPTRVFDFLIGDGLRIYNSMNNFIGRK